MLVGGRGNDNHIHGKAWQGKEFGGTINRQSYSNPSKMQQSTKTPIGEE